MKASPPAGIAAEPAPRAFFAARALLTATLLVPVVVLPGFFFPFITLRAVYFRVLVQVVVAILLFLVLRRQVALDARRDLVFWGLVAWVGANTVAAAFGVAPIRSVFGDHERMGGVWFWAHLLGFYAGLRVFMRERDWLRFLRVAVAVGVAVSLYGLVQYRFHVFKFGIGGVEAGATIGNEGLLGVYLLANAAMAAMLAARSRGRSRLVWLAAAFVITAGMVFSGNRSSLLGLMLGSGIALLAYSLWTKMVRPKWVLTSAIALFALAAALPFISAARWAAPLAERLPAVSRLSTGVDSIRVLQWRAAMGAIRDRPLLGYGPENYQIVWSRFYQPEIYRFAADTRWDRAHNAYLDAFATSGIFGFLALVALWLAIARVTIASARVDRQGAASGESRLVEAVALGFFAAYAFFLFFWFFDLNSTMLWIALAAFVAGRAVKSPLIGFGALRGKRWQTTVVIAAGGIAFAAVLYVHGFATLRMARALDRTRDPRRTPEQVLQGYESVFGSPAPVTQHVFPMYAGYLASVRPHFEEIRNDAASAALFDRAFLLAITEFERQGRQDPLNEHVLVQHARVLILAAYYYDNPRLYESAIAKLQHTVELAPRRVTPLLVLATAYLNAGQPGQALRVYRRAHSVYPPLGRTHAYVAAAHARLGQYDSAAVWLRGALHRGHKPDRWFVLEVARTIAAAGSPRAAAELGQRYLQAETGTPFVWAAHGGRGERHHAELLDTVVDWYLAAGDSPRADFLRSAARALCARPEPLASLAARPHPSPRVEPACRAPWQLAPEF